MKEYITTQESILDMDPAFRRVLTTGAHSQIIAVTLEGGQEIGTGVHEHGDQIFVIMAGWPIEVTLGDQTHTVPAGSVIMVPEGVSHNIANVGSIPARLLSIHAPAERAEDYVEGVIVEE